MASGYIHISRKDIVFDNDNHVVYWKNGARYLGEIAKAVLNPGEETEVVKYYLKSAVTKKAILIDAGVVVGGGDYYFITDDANFINVRIEAADFSSDGGGNGVTVTFLLPESKYYTVHYVEENGDIKLYDVDGDAGTLVPDALPDVTDAAAGDALVLDEDKKPVWVTPESKKYYGHHIKASKSNSYYILTTIITDSNTPFTSSALNAYIKQFTNIRIPATGWAQNSSTGIKGSVFSLRYSTDTKIVVEFIKYIFTSSTPSLTSDSSFIDFDNSTIDDEVVEI